MVSSIFVLYLQVDRDQHAMNINDKIKQILIDKNLTPSYFADEIGVQRSSISHILSGRNRPSFDIIQKVIRRFPDLGYEWIMEEDTQQQPVQVNYGSSNDAIPLVNRRERFNPQSTASYPAPTNSGRNQRNELPPATQNPPVLLDESFPVVDSSNALAIEKKIERILVFYTDGSFREYSPLSN